MNHSERTIRFTEEIWKWYVRHKRMLPWRDLRIADDVQRAYRILLSEVMLQQTQVERVKVIYKRFLERFPSITDLAKASNRDVLMAWRGMGYNRRALMLRDGARYVLSTRVFPQEMNELMRIPGVGHYTAAAVRNFAFNIPTPCLDTNIRRILHRTFIGPENSDGTWKKNDRYLLKLAEEILNEALRFTGKQIPIDTANWHAALMDFGSLVCTKKNPRWDICPLTAKGLCKASYRVKNEGGKRMAKKPRKEPGRFMGTRFIPNRIFRGRIIEELRDEEQGLSLYQIGRRVCLDWSGDHAGWLEEILQKLQRERFLEEKRGKFVLAE